jgi:hypothetical protein
MLGGNGMLPTSSRQQTWNGGFRPTAFVNSQKLFAQISAADIAIPEKAQGCSFPPPGETEVFVFSTPPGESIITVCGGGLSNTLSFTINP